jgi:hypothetical protein
VAVDQHGSQHELALKDRPDSASRVHAVLGRGFLSKRGLVASTYGVTRYVYGSPSNSTRRNSLAMNQAER